MQSIIEKLNLAFISSFKWNVIFILSHHKKGTKRNIRKETAYTIFCIMKATTCALSKELKWWLNYMIVLWIRAVLTYLSHRCEQRCFSHDFYSHSIVEGGLEEMS